VRLTASAIYRDDSLFRKQQVRVRVRVRLYENDKEKIKEIRETSNLTAKLGNDPDTNPNP
jgi:hypothetical protein